MLRAHPFHRDEGGQAIFVIATTMLGMLLMVGLAMDVGQLYNGRRTAQEAADSAAFAGAVVLYQLGTTSEATSAATNDASINGYATDTPTSGTRVTAQITTFSGNTNCVQVDISTPVRTSIMPQQSQFSTVQAHATGCAQVRQSGYAVMATDQTCSTSDLRLQSQGALVVHGGSIQVNSCGSPAASIANGGVVSVDSGYKLDVVGSIDCGLPTSCPNGGSPPGTNTGTAVQPDPFAGAPKPSTSGLTDRGTPQCAPVRNEPGIYTGDTPNNCAILFKPGTYIWKRAAPDMAGGGYACTGNEVNTTSTTAVSAAGTVTITPASMANIGINKALRVSNASAPLNEEVVTPNAVTGTTFTAKFTQTHSGTWTIKGGCLDSVATSGSTGDGGVFFFITTDIYPTAGAGNGCHEVKIDGNAGANTYLSPPDSGTYKGMFLWVDSNCGNPPQTSAQATGITIGGNGAINTSGAIYVPNGEITMDGSNAVLNASQVVAEKIDQQNGDITMNYDANTTYQGQIPALVN